MFAVGAGHQDLRRLTFMFTQQLSTLKDFDQQTIVFELQSHHDFAVAAVVTYIRHHARHLVTADHVRVVRFMSRYVADMLFIAIMINNSPQRLDHFRVDPVGMPVLISHAQPAACRRIRDWRWPINKEDPADFWVRHGGRPCWIPRHHGGRWPMNNDNDQLHVVRKKHAGKLNAQRGHRKSS